MFQAQSIIRWCLVASLAVFILQWVPFSQQEVATQRLEQEIAKSVGMIEQISASCKELIPNENNPLDRWFVSHLFVPNLNQNSTQGVSCILKAQAVHSTRFFIFAQWSLGFEIFKSSSTNAFMSSRFSTEFPLPLSLLPLLIFVFLIPFTDSAKTPFLYLLSYFVVLSGLNLIQFFKFFPKTAIQMMTTDRLFWGLFLFSVWLSLRNPFERKQSRMATNTMEALVNSVLSNLLGIWNPLFYTLISPLCFSLGHQLKNLTLFFNSQIIVLTLSFYFLGLELSNVYSFFANFLTPRYFSFALIFCFLGALIPRIPSPQPLLWRIRNIKGYFFTVCAIETIGFFIPEIRNIPTLTRIALAFLLVEFSQFKMESWRSIFLRWKGPILALLISSFTAAFSSQVGVLDLIVSLCDPRKHPTAVVPFNLLSGFLISFLTGGLASPFFILLSDMIRAYPSPIVRAALFDGVLAGLLLSPFSLFNLYPVFQYKIPIQNILRMRFRQIVVPIFMGLIVYFVGTVTTLRILPPVCFVFCCLAVVTFKLKKSRWKVDTFGLVEHSDPR